MKKKASTTTKTNCQIITSQSKIDSNNYTDYVNSVVPRSSHLKNIFWAFLVGGTICTIGQAFIQLYEALGFADNASALASSTLVLITAILTGLGVYDNIGRVAGVGSTIPITGFANAIVAPAIEFRSEGYIYGIGAKMFVVAGPVIVNGVSLAVIVALVRLALGV